MSSLILVLLLEEFSAANLLQIIHAPTLIYDIEWKLFLRVRQARFHNLCPNLQARHRINVLSEKILIGVYVASKNSEKALEHCLEELIATGDLDRGRRSRFAGCLIQRHGDDNNH
ncbi:unnamed protein product [Clonostachys rosea f. rosea IK726]|uniref:Uncharacterized protein n=1 Tax=Clonostachys rosea f. rosea IK726 TaxID=1349383 RepID=A0ACA9UEM5_BIOOC|nr:unnamed protein product [Clonostachys rosea f. rosea IK726]